MRLELYTRYAARRPWVPRPAQLRRWVLAALAPESGPVGVSVFIVGLARSRRLNADYRGKDKPTNVLSFGGVSRTPDGRCWLGELVICAPLVAREAAAQAKRREAHWAHLTVHGVLHLRGFDHERAAEARKMADIEVQILDKLGFSDPYA